MSHYSVYSAIILAGVQPDQLNSSSVESITWQITLTISQGEHDRAWSKKKRKGLWKILFTVPKKWTSFWKRIIIPTFLCNLLCPLWNTSHAQWALANGMWSKHHIQAEIFNSHCVCFPHFSYFSPSWELYVSGRCLTFSLDFWMKGHVEQKPPTANMQYQWEINLCCCKILKFIGC